MKIYESVEKIDFNNLVKQLVDEREKPTNIDFLIEAKDPARELLKYCVYHLGAKDYRDCIEEISHNMFPIEALLTYFSAIDKNMFMMIETDASDRYENPHGIIKDNLDPRLSNYIRISDLPDSPILDIFLDLLKRWGWWTPDGYHYYNDEFDEDLVSELELS